MKRNISLLIVFLCVLVLSDLVFAQFQIGRELFSNGGSRMICTSHSIQSSAGQTLIGWNSSAAFQNSIGFWYISKNYVGIENLPLPLPEKFELCQNYPNPFNPVTHIRFAVPKTSHVRLEVFNILGQRVAVLLNENRSPGWYSVDFDGGRLPSGSYLYQLRTPDYREIKRMTLIK